MQKFSMVFFLIFFLLMKRPYLEEKSNNNNSFEFVRLPVPIDFLMRAVQVHRINRIISNYASRRRGATVAGEQKWEGYPLTV